jgi:hypothetical protein
VTSFLRRSARLALIIVAGLAYVISPLWLYPRIARRLGRRL